MSVRNPHRPSAVLPNVSTSHATLMDDQTKADIVQPKHDEESAYFYLAGNPDCLWQELSLSSDGFIQPITPKLPPHLPQARERYTIMDKYGHKMKRLIWGFRLLVVPFWFGLLIAALTLASIDAVRYGKRNPAAPDIPPVLVHSFIGGVIGTIVMSVGYYRWHDTLMSHMMMELNAYESEKKTGHSWNSDIQVPKPFVDKNQPDILIKLTFGVDPILISTSNNVIVTSASEAQSFE